MPFMEISSQDDRRRLAQLPRAELEAWQLAKLSQLLDTILPHNSFYSPRLASLPRPLKSLAELAAIPPTTKSDLIGEDPSGLARHLTWPPDRYVRFHRTSGT